MWKEHHYYQVLACKKLAAMTKLTRSGDRPNYTLSFRNIASQARLGNGGALSRARDYWLSRYMSIVLWKHWKDWADQGRGVKVKSGKK